MNRLTWTDLISSCSHQLGALVSQVWDVSGVAAALDGSAGSEAPAQLQSTAVVAAHDKDINALAVSPNDALICTASQDRTAKVTPSHKDQLTSFEIPSVLEQRCTGSTSKEHTWGEPCCVLKH